MYQYFAQSRLQKILLCAGAFLLVLLATYWWWLPRVTVAYLLSQVRSEPSVALTPTTLQLSDAPIERGHAYSLVNLSFESPWSDESYAESTPGYSVAYTFGPLQNGTFTRKVTVLKDPPLRDAVMDGSADIKKFFGSHAQTNFALYEYITRLTPSSVDLLASPVESLSKVILLTIKGNMIIFKQKMYSFQNKNGIKGFLTMKNASTTIAEFFTPSDQEYTMVLDGASVAERDSILNSLRETSVSSTTPKQ